LTDSSTQEGNPTNMDIRKPEEERSYKLERLILKSSGHRLLGTIRVPTDTDFVPPPVLVLHGFPGVAPIVNDIASDLCQAGFAPMMFHYRGCWGSNGRYSFLGAINDTQEALTVLSHRRDLDVSRLAVVGHSFGGLIATCVASRNDMIRAAIALCPVSSLREDLTWRHTKIILRRGLPFVSGLKMPRALREWASLAEDYDPIDFVGRISPRPFLLIHGDKDEIIPLRCSERLLSRAQQPKEMFTVEGADHIFAGKQKITIKRCLDWLKKASELPEGDIATRIGNSPSPLNNGQKIVAN